MYLKFAKGVSDWDIIERQEPILHQTFLASEKLLLSTNTNLESYKALFTLPKNEIISHVPGSDARYVEAAFTRNRPKSVKRVCYIFLPSSL